MTTIYTAPDGSSRVVSSRRKTIQRYRRLCREQGASLVRDLPSIEDPNVFELCDITASDPDLWFPLDSTAGDVDG